MSNFELSRAEQEEIAKKERERLSGPDFEEDLKALLAAQFKARIEMITTALPTSGNGVMPVYLKIDGKSEKWFYNALTEELTRPNSGKDES